MSEQQFGWNYFENEVVIGDKQDKKRMIVIVLSNFMDIPYNRKSFDELVDWLNEQQATIKQLEEDKAIAEDYANIFEKENVKLRKKLNNYKATVLGFLWIMEENGRISGKDDDFVKDLFKLINDE